MCVCVCVFFFSITREYCHWLRILNTNTKWMKLIKFINQWVMWHWLFVYNRNKPFIREREKCAMQKYWMWIFISLCMHAIIFMQYGRKSGSFIHLLSYNCDTHFKRWQANKTGPWRYAYSQFAGFHFNAAINATGDSCETVAIKFYD